VPGATPFYRLRRVTLPLVAPYLFAAFGLSFALSMGELGATVMVYPPGWVTLPVAIFGLTDRGDIFSGAALTIVLVAVTLALLLRAGADFLCTDAGAKRLIPSVVCVFSDNAATVRRLARPRPSARVGA